MAEKSNVEKLVDAGVLDTTGMPPEHIKILNDEFSDEEMKVLHKLSKKVAKGTLKPGDTGGL